MSYFKKSNNQLFSDVFIQSSSGEEKAADKEGFEKLRAELQIAFSDPVQEFEVVTAEDIICQLPYDKH